MTEAIETINTIETRLLLSLSFCSSEFSLFLFGVVLEEFSSVSFLFVLLLSSFPSEIPSFSLSCEGSSTSESSFPISGVCMSGVSISGLSKSGVSMSGFSISGVSILGVSISGVCSPELSLLPISVSMETSCFQTA